MIPLKTLGRGAVVASVRPQGPPLPSGSSLGSGPTAVVHRSRRFARSRTARRAARFATLVALLMAGLVRADDQVVPIQLEAQLFAKVLMYDKNFPDRAGPKARVLLVMKKG